MFIYSEQQITATWVCVLVRTCISLCGRATRYLHINNNLTIGVLELMIEKSMSAGYYYYIGAVIIFFILSLMKKS